MSSNPTCSNAMSALRQLLLLLLQLYGSQSMLPSSCMLYRSAASHTMLYSSSDSSSAALPGKALLSALAVSLLVVPSLVLSVPQDSSAAAAAPASLPSAIIDPIKRLSTNNPVPDTATAAAAAAMPPDIVEMVKDRLAVMRSLVTSEKVGQLRVGDSLVLRLRAVEQELDALQEDIFREPADWDVMSIYPKVFRAYSPLFTAYTDRAFPTTDPVDVALRYALRYEVGGFYTGVQQLEQGVQTRSIRQAQRAFAKMSLSYDRYLKAGDLYVLYDSDDSSNTESAKQARLGGLYDGYNGGPSSSAKAALQYIAPSIEAPRLQDEIVLLKGPDKGRVGQVLWISKGEGQMQDNAVVIKLEAGLSGHREVKTYPYSLVAKTTPPEVQFLDDFVAAYLASAISSGVMYPIDTYKTRVQSRRSGVPPLSEGGVLGLWRGVQFFIADANDAVYLASYGLIKPQLLNSIDPTNSFVVFSILIIAGALGDAIGSIFRLPMEIVCKQIQTGASTDGMAVLLGLLRSESFRLVMFSWAAILARDMPFAGLQIALFDLYKSLLSSLDDAGVSIFIQRGVWGALAGATAAFITTPFDLITTKVMVEATETGGATGARTSPPSDFYSALAEIGPLFRKKTVETVQSGGLAALWSGALPRVLFFGPAATIFFVSYESIYDLIELAKQGRAFWQ